MDRDTHKTPREMKKGMRWCNMLEVTCREIGWQVQGVKEGVDYRDFSRLKS